MTTCSSCQHGPPDNRDSAPCAIAGHVVFHTTPACPSYAAPAGMTTVPVVATRVGNVLQCGKCHSLNMSSSHCRQCGTAWRRS